MSSKLSTEKTPEYSPEEAALVMRLRVFVTMRWFGAFGVVIATLVASLGFNIRFSTLPVYVICVFMLLYNLLLLWQVRRLSLEKGDTLVLKARRYSNIHIVLDLAALTAFLHFTGGIENPFIFFFIFHIFAASIVLSYRTVYVIATLAVVMVGLLVGLEYAGVVPHINLEGFAQPLLYKQVSYIMAVLAALTIILYTATYMASAISGELRKRQREVVQLRERLLQEKDGKLEQSTQEIANLEQERDRFLRFLSIAAHDLKAPLTAIQGYLWVMLGGFSGEINEKQKNMLERSTRRINELLNLISDLLDIPRIETGQIVQEMKGTSLPQVLKTAVEDQQQLAEEKGLKLVAEITETLPEIRGSAPRLQQVITNLLSNAINYTLEGKITIIAREVKNEIWVEVMDTGIGIPSDDQKHIFDDFYRASNVEVKGTGLGLSITRRIVEAHGGKIWVECPCPETNCGTKFTFTLPKQRKSKRRQL